MTTDFFAGNILFKEMGRTVIYFSPVAFVKENALISSIRYFENRISYTWCKTEGNKSYLKKKTFIP